MKILSLNNSSTNAVITEVAEALKKGGLVVCPSDTVYGLAVDATNKDAVEKLITFKSRQRGKAISVYVASLDDAEKYVEISPSQKNKIHALVPGPYTIVLPSRHKLVKALESERGTLGVRMPNYDFVKDLVKSFGKPITSTSANISGDSPFSSIDAFLNSLSEKKKSMIDIVIDAGQLPKKLPSTVIDMTVGDIKVLRQGDELPQGTEKYISQSEEDTKNLASKLLHDAMSHDKPVVFLLYGDLGAGKTVFVKGIGDELGISKIISPTFVIYYEYPIEKGDLYHFDLYRLKDSEELADLKIGDILQKGNVVCIEWSEKSETILDLLKQKAYVVHVNIWHEDETTRSIIVRTEK